MELMCMDDINIIFPWPEPRVFIYFSLFGLSFPMNFILDSNIYIHKKYF
jgi:hypothetical protein